MNTVQLTFRSVDTKAELRGHVIGGEITASSPIVSGTEPPQDLVFAVAQPIGADRTLLFRTGGPPVRVPNNVKTVAHKVSADIDPIDPLTYEAIHRMMQDRQSHLARTPWMLFLGINGALTGGTDRFVVNTNFVASISVGGPDELLMTIVVHKASCQVSLGYPDIGRQHFPEKVWLTAEAYHLQQAIYQVRYGPLVALKQQDLTQALECLRRWGLTQEEVRRKSNAELLKKINQFLQQELPKLEPRISPGEVVGRRDAMMGYFKILLTA